MGFNPIAENKTEKTEDELREERINAHHTELNQIKRQATQEGKLHYDEQGKFEYAVAPNGEQSTLTEQQWCEVRSTNFKAWFGDWRRLYTLAHSEELSGQEKEELERLRQTTSKVVSPNGEPALYFHGTKWDFETFRPSDVPQKHEGVYFSQHIETARHYAGQDREGNIKQEDLDHFNNRDMDMAKISKEEFKKAWFPWTKRKWLKSYIGWRKDARDPLKKMHSVVLPCYIKSVNPLVIDNGPRGGEWGGFDPTVKHYLKDKKEGNYDGAMFLNTYDSGPLGTVLNVVHSNQIKSAETNNGLYETSNDSINS